MIIRCPKCNADMEPGFIADKSYGNNFASSPEWAEGVAENSIWTGVKLRGREMHPVTTYRCPDCGYLESYARAK